MESREEAAGGKILMLHQTNTGGRRGSPSSLSRLNNIEVLEQLDKNWTRTRRREGKMVGQSEGAFGNDLTNVMTPDSQEEIARRFVSKEK